MRVLICQCLHIVLHLGSLAGKSTKEGLEPLAFENHDTGRETTDFDKNNENSTTSKNAVNDIFEGESGTILLLSNLTYTEQSTHRMVTEFAREGENDTLSLSQNLTDVMETANGTTSSSSSNSDRSAATYFPWDNPQNVMSKKTSDDITSALQCYVFPVVTAIGTIGSILSLIVLFQKRLRRSTTTIVLIGLAISDLLFLVTNFVRKSNCIVKEYDQVLADKINATTFFYMFYLKTSFSRVSTLLVVLISVERLIAVAFPLKVKQIVTKERMLAAVLFLYVLVFGSLAALPPQYTYTYIRGKPYISQTEFALQNEESLKVYNEYFLPIVFRYIPVLIVLILNSIIIFILSQSNRFQKSVVQQDPKRKDEQRKITRMLLSVAVIFLICLLPGDLLLLCSTAIDGFEFFGTYHNLFLVLSDLCLLFEMTNSSVNFITYMVLNRNFYETYVNLFCCCLNNMRLRKALSGKTKSRDTNETVLAKKTKEAFKELVVDSGIEDKSGTENETASVSVEGHVNKAYLE